MAISSSAVVVLRIALLSGVLDYWHVAEGTPVEHECIHDKVAIKELPFITSRVGRSVDNLESSSNSFSKIRITLHYMEPLDEELREELFNPNGPLMKAIKVMSSTLSVRPIQQNLTIPASCKQHSIVNISKCSHATCGIFDVPSNFVQQTEVCNTDSGPCMHIGGPGAPNTDFLLLVGTQPHNQCGSSTFAFSSPCCKDKYHRPSAGYINFCTRNIVRNSDAKKIGTVFFNLILHELSHALGFSQSTFNDFHDGNLNLYLPNATGTYDGNAIMGLNSTRVLEVGRSYFSCSNLSFVPLENNGNAGSVNSHWEARVLHHEIMNGFLSNDYAVLSNFTLAFFEDSGWYEVNYTFINNYDQFELQWGRGLGCSFVVDSCTNETYPYLCDADRRSQCTFDLVSRGRCKSTFAHFDGCPVVIADDNTSCIYEINSPVPNEADEIYGAMSMCVDLAVETGSQPVPQCHQFVLRENKEECSQQLPRYGISLKNETYWCNDSEVIDVRQGFLLCPTLEQATIRFSDGAAAQDRQCDTHSTKGSIAVPTSAESRDVAHSGNTGIKVGIVTVTAMVVVVTLLLLAAGIVRYYRRKLQGQQHRVHADDQHQLVFGSDVDASSDEGFDSDVPILTP